MPFNNFNLYIINGYEFLELQLKRVLKSLLILREELLDQSFWYFLFIKLWNNWFIKFLSLRSPQDNFYLWLIGIFIIVIIVPFTAVTARRLHDVGRSGWWQLISGIPYVGIIGAIFLIIWWCSEGEKKKNKYGKPIKLKR